ncbi:MAG: error-prone DNA polymerase [Deltaproteobacteria bacterium]|nr:error-prone DNA polymerase [Deltaproteobacteria bacterium]
MAGSSSQGFAELCARSCFSLLQGASQPEEMAERAHELGLASIALCDRDGMYGSARAHMAAREVAQPLIVGAELTMQGTDATVLMLVEDHAGYTSLCRLLTRAHADQPKGSASLRWQELGAGVNGLWAILPAPYDQALSCAVAESFGRDRVRIAVQRHLDPAQSRIESQAISLAKLVEVDLIATARPLFHHPSRKPVADVLCCIRNKTTLDAAGPLLQLNAEAVLSSPAKMAQRFRDHPEWLASTLPIAQACQFSLAELRYRFPCEAACVDETPDQALARLVREKQSWRYPNGVPEPVMAQLRKELALIEELGVAPYFLSVYEIVEIARERRILCQGRGSAANSAVCYVLGITAVDPARANLLFERFLSAERRDPPDIDVDFEHERREEVIQEIYERYGRDRAAMVSEIISYRGKSSLRDVGKAFGLSLEQVDRLSSMMLHSWSGIEASSSRIEEVGLDPNDERLRKVVTIAGEIERFPRHLSIHVGGFVLSAEPLEQVAPVEPARMPDRTVIPWDKDDLDTLGFFKVDILALGMLTAIRKALAIVMPDLDPLTALAAIPPEDPAVYDALCKADTVGVFQIESRAQMSMLPRLKPRRFYDLVIEVAIVRPGPIQGGMVHPYLRRRAGKDPITYPHPCLRPILERTLGVPLFQEQVMQISIVGAGYSAGEADQLRRDMAAWRKHGRLMLHRQRLLDGFARTGISAQFGEQLFKQIQGFGEYGFPESHAASFALLVYASAWLKVHHPAAFACSLINSQPMGFYTPGSIVRDAKEHGVEVLPPTVTDSRWDCTLTGDSPPKLRLGMRLIRGLGELAGRAIEQALDDRPFESLDDLVTRASLKKNHVEALAEAGALEPLVQGRRHALWRARAPRSGPLFDKAPVVEQHVPLPPLRPREQLVLDYARVGLSIHDHPMCHMRDRLGSRPVVRIGELASLRDGCAVYIAGVVLNRQRPGTASGVVFMTLEDETGHANLVIWADVFERHHHEAVNGKILLIEGRLQRQEGVTHVVVVSIERLDVPRRPDEPDDDEMSGLAVRSRDFH